MHQSCTLQPTMSLTSLHIASRDGDVEIVRSLCDEGADVKKGGDDSDEEFEGEEQSLFEEVERQYFPERYKFHPFGDPWIEKRKLQARRRRQANKPAWDSYYG